MELDSLTQIIELFGNFSFAAVFLWLFVREMNSHERTRADYRRDLREIAALRAEERLFHDDTERVRIPNGKPTELP